jgi:hypothetical protein
MKVSMRPFRADEHPNSGADTRRYRTSGLRRRSMTIATGLQGGQSKRVGGSRSIRVWVRGACGTSGAAWRYVRSLDHL